MKFAIRSRFTGNVLFEIEADSIKLAVEAAVEKKINLWGADLRDADLRGAYLWGADLRGAYLWGADLRGADLRDADLRDADLRGAYLWGADLRGAYLRGADLRGADLRDADLRDADLRGADLRGADLRGADLRGADLRGAKLDENTIMPGGETWRQYLDEVVPALLTAGGKRVKEVVEAGAWDCHDWGNCPMAVAFGVDGENETPLLLRPRVREFVHLFDQRLIPEPEVTETETSNRRHEHGNEHERNIAEDRRRV